MGSDRILIQQGDLAAWARDAAANGFSPTQVATAIVRRLAVDLGLDPDHELAPALSTNLAAGHLPAVPATIAPDAWSLGRVYEVASSASDRRAGGVHYTPPELARRLVSIALEGADPRASICDPAVGGGSFLLAAAEQLEAFGAPVAAIAAQLWGVDIDAAAAQVAQAAVDVHVASRVGHWSALRSRIVVADTLVAGRSAFGAVIGDGFDAVIGNPPFQNQLSGATARTVAQGRSLRTRWDVDAGPYADSAGYFLLAALELARPGGRVVMIQPRSILATAGAAPIREAVDRRSRLRGAWSSERIEFDADVWVCALVLDRLGTAADARTATEPIRRWRGTSGGEAPSLPGDITPGRWGRLAVDPVDVAPAFAVDAVVAATPTVGSMATATAGFREQFYGLVPHTAEREDRDGGEAEDDVAPLLTVGMIEPFRSRWGDDEFRYAGRRWRRPVVDLVALAEDSPRLAEWVAARRRPKLIVATQTKVIEVVVDIDGRWIPSTPTIAVEAPAAQLFHLAAAISSPIATAVALDRVAGAALSSATIKLSARQLLDLPLPRPGPEWDAGARCAMRATRAGDPGSWRDAMVELGGHMIAAAGVDDVEGELLTWWTRRLPGWR